MSYKIIMIQYTIRSKLSYNNVNKKNKINSFTILVLKSFQ